MDEITIKWLLISDKPLRIEELGSEVIIGLSVKVSIQSVSMIFMIFSSYSIPGESNSPIRRRGEKQRNGL